MSFRLSMRLALAVVAGAALSLTPAWAQAGRFRVFRNRAPAYRYSQPSAALHSTPSAPIWYLPQSPSYGSRWSDYNFGRQDFDVYPNRD